MRNRLALGFVVAGIALAAITAATIAQSENEFAAKPTWETASAEAVQAQLNR